MQGAFDVRVAGGLAVAPVIDGEYVVASLGQPGHVQDMAADVLSVAMEEVHRAPGVTLRGFCRQPPAMQGFAIGRLEVDVFVFEVQPVRGDVGDPVRVEEHATATGQQEKCSQEPGHPGVGDGQK